MLFRYLSHKNPWINHSPCKTLRLLCFPQMFIILHSKISTEHVKYVFCNSTSGERMIVSLLQCPEGKLFCCETTCLVLMIRDVIYCSPVLLLQIIQNAPLLYTEVWRKCKDIERFTNTEVLDHHDWVMKIQLFHRLYRRTCQFLNQVKFDTNPKIICCWSSTHEFDWICQQLISRWIKNLLMAGVKWNNEYVTFY